jgi:hypothetical protein
MTVSKQDIVERIARVLAGQAFSANAGGAERSASDQVEATWARYVNDAVAVLKTMREPDESMAAVGDTEIWERMVRAAIPEGELI